MYRKSATSTLNEWKMRFLPLTTSYRLTIVHIHDKLDIVSCELKGGQTKAHFVSSTISVSCGKSRTLYVFEADLPHRCC